VYYKPQDRTLAVEVRIKHFYQDLREDWIEGSLYYFLGGEVSDDGTQWLADCFTQYKMTIFTTKPNVLEDMEEPEHMGEVFFRKISPDGEN
jgi:hypothetical protein